jgi:hypothetical protein
MTYRPISWLMFPIGNIYPTNTFGAPQELAQLQKDIEEEEKRLNEFNDWFEDWERAERTRQFIAVYTEKSLSWPAEKQPKYREWIERATRAADRIDPFVLERQASVVDRKHELARR